MTKRAFTQAELRRAVDAARACGLEVGAVEIDRNGTIRILMASASHSSKHHTAHRWIGPVFSTLGD